MKLVELLAILNVMPTTKPSPDCVVNVFAPVPINTLDVDVPVVATLYCEALAFMSSTACFIVLSVDSIAAEKASWLNPAVRDGGVVMVVIGI